MTGAAGCKWFCRPAALALATALTMSFGLLAQEPEKDQKPEVAQEKPLLDEKASAEVLKSLQQLRAAVKKRDQGDKAKAGRGGKDSPAPAASTNGHTADFDVGGAGPAARAIPQENESQGRTGPIDQ